MHSVNLLALTFFDEPSNGLDPEGIIWIRELMRGLAREGRTVLVSSHLMNETATFADHLVVLGRGRLGTRSSPNGPWLRSRRRAGPRSTIWSAFCSSCARPDSR
jgi:ABC-2 type transport system ATP-binding protein